MSKEEFSCNYEQKELKEKLLEHSEILIQKRDAKKRASNYNKINQEGQPDAPYIFKQFYIDSNIEQCFKYFNTRVSDDEK